MVLLRKQTYLVLMAMGLGVVAAPHGAAFADPMVPDGNISFGSAGMGNTGVGSQSRTSEKKVVHGHRSLPPGYQDAPSMEFNHGADPDHLAKVHRDSVTGSDLSKYGTAYQNSGPYGDGAMGDSTGNGWVTHR
ncbi:MULTISPECIES: hypothetical protein [Acetobacter]|uniref:hypothetical protein n=1 Tax=Acetobacter TaxID=434 RepID=UPI000A3A965D|nr:MULTISPECIES: hypothetical protein [Acetobacter]MBS0959187.1 hypothetical protein [Acetobacter thailandicus]MBS0984925.1 hypothetical protein [Acetobacter thailandicus]MBS1003560.1 hypothetical protein [Acetobacter thailandicus]OUI88384.1 hypothetical protein HK11_06100 [Acetobacter sp. DmW_043]OUJ11703.1 hypothetical protein HK25_12820 [Acetobacter sp. DsW_059]